MIRVDESFEEVHGIIRSRWIPEILDSIKAGNHSYGEILDSIDYISGTELNRKLNLLVEKRALEKREESNRSHYDVLELGEDLHHIFYHLVELKEKYF
ncbi:winged helix-turn-helix transcriptional regulator [Isachenkonia alkalipeptolytica]|nr:winged helix-turn-helix transcriptional regulator [Isachenkonia alkalipeptolytica]